MGYWEGKGGWVIDDGKISGKWHKEVGITDFYRSKTNTLSSVAYRGGYSSLAVEPNRKECVRREGKKQGEVNKQRWREDTQKTSFSTSAEKESKEERNMTEEYIEGNKRTED